MNDSNKVQKQKKWSRTLKWVLSISTVVASVLTIVATCNSIEKDNRSTKPLEFMYCQVTSNYVNSKIHTSFFVTIYNGGKSSFEVKARVKARIWYIAIEALTTKPHFDWETYMKNTPANDSTYNFSYAGEYQPTDSVRNSFDFFRDTSTNYKRKWTILARADADFELPRVLLGTKTARDYCYFAIIRDKQADSSSVIAKELKNINKK